MRLKTDYPTTSKDCVNLQYVMNSVYPVGAIYISTLATNPATLFGFGTWATFGAGKTLVGIDSTDTDFDTVEETRGEKTHTLTGAESGTSVHDHGTTGNQNANHTHHEQLGNAGAGTGGIYGPATLVQLVNSVGGLGVYTMNEGQTHGHAVNNSSAANASSAHNNIQPSIVVYMWKRTL